MEKVSGTIIEEKDNESEDDPDILDTLKQLQEHHSDLEAEFRREINELNKRYRSKCEPLFQKRYELLQEYDYCEHFWLLAMKNHRILNDMIQPADIPVLEYLEDIQCEWKEQEATADLSSPGFSLHFIFKENNPYFGPPTDLVKTYQLEESSDLTDPVLSAIETTMISWKPGKDITKKIITKKQKHSRTKEIRKITETVSVNSFFQFFTKRQALNLEQLENMTEEQIDEIESAMEIDYEVGCIFRDKIVSHAIDWYFNDAIQSDDNESDLNVMIDEDDEDLLDESLESEHSGSEGSQPDADGWKTYEKMNVENTKTKVEDICKQQ